MDSVATDSRMSSDAMNSPLATEDVTQTSHLSSPSSTAPVSTPFVPTIGAWVKPPKIIPEAVPYRHETLIPKERGKSNPDLDILPPAIKEDGQLRFPWAAKMDPSIRNLHRTTTPTYMEDGTPKVHIPNHVLLKGLENQQEYVIGQFNRCLTPSGGLINAVANRIWGKKCKIFSRKLGESSYMFHIPDAPTRAWVLQRGLWHIDDCIILGYAKNIPSRLYSHWGISWIASGLGEPITTDKPRLDPFLMGVAKIMVEVELEKGFPHRIAVEDKRGNVTMVDVEYSWLPSKCSRCGFLGHKETRCLLLSQQGTASNLVSTVPAIPVVVEGNTSSQTTHVEAAKTSHVTTPIVAQETLVDCVSLDAAVVNTGSVSACTYVSPPLSVEAAPVETTTYIHSPTVVAGHTTTTTEATTFTTALCNHTPINTEVILPSSPMVTVPFTPPRSGSLDNENVQENVLESNQFAVFDVGVYGYEMGVESSQHTRGGRTIKPTQKIQDQWITVGGRSKRGRGGRGGRG
ncbi:hypothetical protein CARUB_v10021307mg [Capsella rubella]|uniref:DUF4283 domain-containing protein n=2 Tax=Capsella rubella TaxID=81985 RepID=R0IB31_9BRAS|nr:hypothetical protein CARUB_v10021307mg [Capsella rubella]